MKRTILFVLLVTGISLAAPAQNIGIGTTEPRARLHVADSSVLFSGAETVNALTSPPVSGRGSRMMWMPTNAAFRAGFVTGDFWDANKIGLASFAAGRNVTASGTFAVAMGDQTVASGTNAFAAGANSQATGYTAVALGNYVYATGDFAVAMTYNARADGKYAVAIGYGSEASANQSVALGNGAKASGLSAVSLGHYSHASGTASMAMGPRTIANGYLETVLGHNNLPTNGSPNSWVDTDPLLVVGNGTELTRRTALTMLKNGNLGLGTTQPQARLQVDGDQLIKRNSSVGAAHLTLEETQSGDGSRLQFRNSTISNRNWELYGRPHLTNAADAIFNIYYSQIGDAMVLRGTGNVWFRGTVSQNSDATLKKNITTVNNALEKVTKLNGYNYYWKDSTRGQELQAGLLAQEIEALMPELVSADEAGIKSVNYSGLIPYLLEAIKEQQRKIEELEKKITLLQNR